jgi:HSP20 family protein
MMADMESRMSELMEGIETEKFLPAPGFQHRMLPAFRGEFLVDVKEHEDEVVIVADLPGINKEDISLNLVDPRTLEISSMRGAEKEETKEGYFMRERLYGAMRSSYRLLTLLPLRIWRWGLTRSRRGRSMWET